MAKTLKILGVHGLGDHRNSTWKEDWTKALREVFPGQNDINLEFEYVTYDPIFEDTDISAWESAQALWKLARSGVSSAFSRRRGIIGDVSDKIKWTAGYVVAWVEDEEFQRQTRKLILDAIHEHQPDIILAHSLGSLITYNAFSHSDAQKEDLKRLLKKVNYITLGSQIGNPFVVRNLTPGRISPLSVKHWYHLYNKEDDVFTAPIKLWDADNFNQIVTYFDVQGYADHDATEYLKHNNTISFVWRQIAEHRINAKQFGPKKASRKRSAGRPKTKNKRALLVGINDYPNEADRLKGCVNDTYLMSSVLQECGFPAENIRLCLNDRASAQGILERLEWLLDDPQPGDERLFYYSGHGAQIPEYGEENEADRYMETLVPHDFDWSPDTAISDDQIFQLYSQLPYNMQFSMIFDCCHSGGIHRDGGARARGLNPPDDIRHRSIRWSKEHDMWVPRDFNGFNNEFSSNDDETSKYFGNNGAVARLGRASLIRGQSEKQYRATKRSEKNKPVGPYLPLILEACGEDEFAYEYEHGVISYGAFTFALSNNLRKAKRITFEKLVDKTSIQLRDLGYQQKPNILGPASITGMRVPWLS